MEYYILISYYSPVSFIKLQQELNNWFNYSIKKIIPHQQSSRWLKSDYRTGLH